MGEDSPAALTRSDLPPITRPARTATRQKERAMALTQYVENPKFEEYSERFKEHFLMERRGGILLLKMHTGGGNVKWGWELHRAIGQAFRTIGSDPENEVMILTSAGDYWIAGADSTSFEGEEEDPAFCSYEYMYTDGRRMVNSLVNEIEIPTIGVIPGPGFHLELALMCDLTICSDTAILADMHFEREWVPGDGIHSAFIELLGVKRAAWVLLMNEQIDAQKALEYALVNEVVAKDELMDRAWQIAEQLASKKRITRRMATQIVRRPWKKRIADDLDAGWTAEMYAYLADQPRHPRDTS
ncbi:MAG TPA: enoyl-CoA hydratase/isomerase family protein [Myxococcales bacterium]|nr:enoyl-CoA hydratase/isomerase family protein [Myxococcales bacterium]